MHTRSAILVFSKGTRAGEAFEKVDLALREEVLQRIRTLVKNVAPVFLLCEPSDIGIAERQDPYTDAPSIYVYDRYPGGTGLSETLLEKVDLIFGACLELVERCGCERGCPSSIGPDLEQRRPEDNRKTSWIPVGYLRRKEYVTPKGEGYGKSSGGLAARLKRIAETQLQPRRPSNT